MLYNAYVTRFMLDEPADSAPGAGFSWQWQPYAANCASPSGGRRAGGALFAPPGKATAFNLTDLPRSVASIVGGVLDAVFSGFRGDGGTGGGANGGRGAPPAKPGPVTTSNGLPACTWRSRGGSSSPLGQATRRLCSGTYVVSNGPGTGVGLDLSGPQLPPQVMSGNMSIVFATNNYRQTIQKRPQSSGGRPRTSCGALC